MSLIGNTGDPVGARPVSVSVVGALEGRPINARKWRDLPTDLMHDVDRIEGWPYMVDA